MWDETVAHLPHVVMWDIRPHIHMAGALNPQFRAHVNAEQCSHKLPWMTNFCPNCALKILYPP
jgi:predicted amidophosphoribosyltransferase